MQDLQTDKTLALEAAQGSEISWKRIFRTTARPVSSSIWWRGRSA